MRYLKAYEEVFNLTEIWEVDNNKEITGYSLWLDPKEIEYLTNLNLIFTDMTANAYDGTKVESFPMHYKKDKKKIKEILKIYKTVTKYNI